MAAPLTERGRRINQLRCVTLDDVFRQSLFVVVVFLFFHIVYIASATFHCWSWANGGGPARRRSRSADCPIGLLLTCPVSLPTAQSCPTTPAWLSDYYFSTPLQPLPKRRLVTAENPVPSESGRALPRPRLLQTAALESDHHHPSADCTHHSTISHRPPLPFFFGMCQAQ